MEQAVKKRVSMLQILILQLNVLVFSLSSVMMKLASGKALFSWPFVLFYGGGIALLGIYALVWQQILKRIPLSVAYANRAMSMLYSMVFGALLFQERITLPMLLGTAVIGAGILVMVNADED